MNEQVGVLAPTRQLLQRSVLVVGEHRDLVVGGKRKSRRALIDPVSKGWDRVHQKMRRDAQATHLERLTRIPLDELHLRRHVVEAHRKVGGIHLVRERRLQRFGRTRRSHDREMRAGHKSWWKERKSLDVIEVRVGDEEVEPAAALTVRTRCRARQCPNRSR